MMIVQDRQVFRNVSLFHRARLHEFAHAEGPAAQSLEQREPAGFGKDGKEARDSGELGW